MTFALPHTLSSTDAEDGTPEIDRVQENFDALANAMIDGGGKSLRIRAGSGTITWPGGAVASNVLTVSHGLGGTPVSVVVQSGGSAGVTLYPSMGAFTLTATQFNVQATTVDGQLPLNTAASTVYWVAIG